MFDPLRTSSNRTTRGWVDLADVREHRERFVALGFALVVLGALAIFTPFVTAVVTTMLLGWLLVVGGLAEGVHAVADRRWRASDWELVSAVFYVVAGALVIAFPLTSKLFVTLVLTAFLVGDGVLKIFRAAQHRGAPAGGWLLFDGILSLGLGVLLWLHWPSSAAWALGLLVGVHILSNGVSLLVLALGAGHAIPAGR